MIAEFADNDVGQQRLGGHAAGDRALGCRSLNHALLTIPAGVFGCVDRLDPKLGGHDVEHLSDLFTHGMKLAAAARAGFVLDIDRDIKPWQIGRQRSPIALRFLGSGVPLPLLLGSGSLASSFGCASGLLKALKGQLQLVRINLFGPCAIKGAAHLLNKVVELFYLGHRFGMLCF